MRLQTHEYIPIWVTQRAQLNKAGWYRVCGTIHPFGILLYGGSILVDVGASFSSGSWVVSYGYWNGAFLETMFVARLSFSADMSIGYERTHYCAGPYAIQCAQMHRDLDKELEEQAVQSWMFITAENPYSRHTPDQNSAYNLELRNELLCSNLQFWEGWGIPHCSAWIPEASFLVLGVDQDTALLYKNTYRQNAVVFGEIGGSALFL